MEFVQPIVDFYRFYKYVIPLNLNICILHHFLNIHIKRRILARSYSLRGYFSSTFKSFKESSIRHWAPPMLLHDYPWNKSQSSPAIIEKNFWRKEPPSKLLGRTSILSTAMRRIDPPLGFHSTPEVLTSRKLLLVRQLFSRQLVLPQISTWELSMQKSHQ